MDVGGKVEINLDTLVLLESPHQFFSPPEIKNDHKRYDRNKSRGLPAC